MLQDTAFSLFGRVLAAPEHVSVSLARSTFLGSDEEDWSVGITFDDDSLPETVEEAIEVARRLCPSGYYVVVDSSETRCALRFLPLDAGGHKTDFERLMAIAMESTRQAHAAAKNARKEKAAAVSGRRAS
jgi:hypothetical protein